MANKSWLKGAESHRGQSEMEDHKRLQWQSPITKWPSEKKTIGQKMIMNTRYIFPSKGTRSVKAP